MTGYIGFRLMLALFSIIPFWLLYGMSDLLFLVLYYLVGYRKAVVRENLSRSFPNMTEQELKRLEVKFYRHLADIFLEGIKGLTLSDKETIRRYKVLTPDAPNLPFRAGQASLFVGSHYNNWEYGALGCGLQVEPLAIVFYKPIKNKKIENYVRDKRQRKGTYFAPLNETSKTFVDLLPQSPMFIMLADQSPSNPKASHWVQFLNQDTPVLHGPAKYAQRYDLPIYLIRTRKAKRGFYEVSAELIIEKPNELAAEEISAAFMAKLEELILEQPEYWLWSHKRWKHKRS